MANKSEQKPKGGGEPPLDYFDLSYVAPLMVASAIVGKPFSPFRIGPDAQFTGGITQRTGATMRRIFFERFFARLTAPVERVQEYRSALVANWFVSQYVPRPYQYIILGPPLGSMAYLSSVLDAPFLPLNYRVAVGHAKPAEPDAVGEHLKRSKQLADRILDRDPDVEIVGEYDPIHERHRVARASLMRFRFKTLPRAYQQFIRSHLAPGGAVILVESRIGWRQYLISKDFTFQIGVPGGIPDEEFVRGSKRISEFREKHLNYKDVSYRIKANEEVRPEARFGVSPHLRASIINSMEEIKRPLCQLFSSDIYQINNLVSNLFLRCARRAGKRPCRFFVHSGIFIAPKECADSMLLPVWIPDGGMPSFKFVQQFMNTYQFQTDLSLLALEPSVSGPPDVVGVKKWREFLTTKGAMKTIGTSSRMHPHDLTGYFKFWSAMKSTSKKIKDPLDVRVNLDMLIEEAQAAQIFFTMYQQ